MKFKKNYSILVVLIMGSVLVLTVLFPGFTQAQKAIEWKTLTSWIPDLPQNRNFYFPFMEKVNQRAAGRMKISWVGPEGVPSFQQLKPVREGLFDAVFTVPSYHVAEIVTGSMLAISPGSGKERRAAGMLKILDEAYRKKANITLLSAMSDGCGMNLVLNKKVEKADLTGLKIRTSPQNYVWIKALNGSPMGLELAEAYTALQKGTVDGLTSTAASVLDNKFYEVAKYIVRPCYFTETTYAILVSLNSWNRLPKDLQDVLTKTAIEVEEEGRVSFLNSLKLVEKELQKNGMEFLALPPKEGEKLQNVAYERSWEDLILKRDPEFGPRLKEISDQMKKK